MSAGWLEPEEGWYPGWSEGDIVLDKRSGLLLVLGECQREVLFEGDSYDGDPTDMVYFSYRVRHLDGTDLTDGYWRPPDDLEPLTPLEVLALAAR